MRSNIENHNRALGLVVKEQYEDLNPYITFAIRHIEASGADIVTLTAATMHVVFEQVRVKTSAPIIRIPEIAAEAAVSRGYEKVGSLGTIFAMEKDYLKNAFAEKGT